MSSLRRHSRSDVVGVRSCVVEIGFRLLIFSFRSTDPSIFFQYLIFSHLHLGQGRLSSALSFLLSGSHGLLLLLLLSDSKTSAHLEGQHMHRISAPRQRELVPPTPPCPRHRIPSPLRPPLRVPRPRRRCPVQAGCQLHPAGRAARGRARGCRARDAVELDAARVGNEERQPSSLKINHP
jgi:hypothetical protein